MYDKHDLLKHQTSIVTNEPVEQVQYVWYGIDTGTVLRKKNL